MREKESGAGLEATYSSLVKTLRHLLQLTCLDKSVVSRTYKAACTVADQVRISLADFTNFLKIKAIQNFSLGSYPFLNKIIGELYSEIKKNNIYNGLFRLENASKSCCTRSEESDIDVMFC